MTDRLDNRKALVTGGGNGIGAAITVALAASGAQVLIADTDVAAAQSVAARSGASFVKLDATDAQAVASAVAERGPFDILVNNVGMDQHAFFTDTSAADWQRLLSVNLVSVLACTHAVLPGMQRARFGRLINIASEAARGGSRGGSVYAAAKAGVIGFTKSIARENARYGITANVVAPGPIDTPMLRAPLAKSGDKLLNAMINATLLGRLGQPEEVAAAVAFLASDGAAFITGETLGVSGGMGIGT